MSRQKKATSGKTIADSIYHRLRHDIVSGALPPGDKLRMEMLTRRYDVGMSPIREALMRLTGDALVRIEGQRGFWVSEISLDELEDTMRTRALVETEALARSIEKGDEEWENMVRDSYRTLAALEANLETGDADHIALWEEANEQFHKALVSASDSPWLERLRLILHQHTKRYRMISLANMPADRDVHEEHEAIMQAAVNRQTLRACRLIEHHLQRTADAVRNALREREEAEEPASVARKPKRAKGLAKAG